MFHSFYGGRTGPRGPVGAKGDSVTFSQSDDRSKLIVTTTHYDTGTTESESFTVKGDEGAPFRAAVSTSKESNLKNSEGTWLSPNQLTGTEFTTEIVTKLNAGWGLYADDTKLFYYWDGGNNKWISMNVGASGNDIHLDIDKALYIKNNGNADKKIISLTNPTVSGAHTIINIGTESYDSTHHTDLQLGNDDLYGVSIKGNGINITAAGSSMTLDGANEIALKISQDEFSKIKITSNNGITITGNTVVETGQLKLGKTGWTDNSNRPTISYYDDNVNGWRHLANVYKNSSTNKYTFQFGTTATSDDETANSYVDIGHIKYTSSIQLYGDTNIGTSLNNKHLFLYGNEYIRNTSPTIVVGTSDGGITGVDGFKICINDIKHPDTGKTVTQRGLLVCSYNTTNSDYNILLGAFGAPNHIFIGSSTNTNTIYLTTNNQVSITGGLSISGAITKVANITVTNGISAGQTISTTGNIIGKNITSKGSATQPIYFNSEGVATPTAYQLNKTVPTNAVFTDTVTTVTKSGSGNVITSMQATNGKITYTMGNALPTSGGTLNGNLILNGFKSGSLSPTTAEQDMPLPQTFTATNCGEIWLLSLHASTGSALYLLNAANTMIRTTLLGSQFSGTEVTIVAKGNFTLKYKSNSNSGVSNVTYRWTRIA